jgi:hypothetical protein
MSAIDPKRLTQAMELAQVTTTELTDRLNDDGSSATVTLSYVARICKGDRRLKRNPVLRARIARALGVRRDWIEAERPLVDDAA